MKSIRVSFSMIAMITAISVSFAFRSNNSLLTTAWGDSPLIGGIDCNQGTIVGANPCDTPNRSLGTCKIEFSTNGTQVDAFTASDCFIPLYKQPM